MIQAPIVISEKLLNEATSGVTRFDSPEQHGENPYRVEQINRDKIEISSDLEVSKALVEALQKPAEPSIIVSRSFFVSLKADLETLLSKTNDLLEENQ